MCARTRTREERGKTRHKKRSAKNSTPILSLKYILNIESVAVFFPYVDRVFKVGFPFLSLVNFRGRDSYGRLR